MRFRWGTPLICAVVLAALAAPGITVAGAAEEPRLVYAVLAHRPELPEGFRTVLRLYTRHAHERDGDSVAVLAYGAQTEAQQERTNEAPYGLWRVTRRTPEGARVITELRRHLGDRGSASFIGIAFESQGGAPGTFFTVRDYNTRVQGRIGIP